MTSPLLLRIIHVFANFLILSDNLLVKCFSPYVSFEGNLDSANKFNNTRHNDVKLRHCVNQGMARSCKC